jgi:hypothetical protein
VRQQVNVAALGIRLSSLRSAFELHGSYAPRDPKEAEQFGIKVVVVDIPRPPKMIDAPTDNNGHH